MYKFTFYLLLSVQVLASCQAHKKSDEAKTSSAPGSEDQNGSNPITAENAGKVDGNTRTDVPEDKKEPATPPAPTAPAPTAPASTAPAPTHKVAVTCTNEVKLTFTITGKELKPSLSFGKGPQINGQPSSLLTVSCPKILTALNDKAFPVATTVAKAVGGPKVKMTCNTGILSMNVIEGDLNGTNSQVTLGVDLEDADVCLQIRNVVNALNL